MAQALQAVNDLHEIIGLGTIVFTIALALIFGRTPHRVCAVMLAFETFGMVLLLSALTQEQRFLATKIRALVFVFAYAALTVRWRDRWLILLTGLQGYATLVHIAAWIDPTIWLGANSLVLNVVGWLMIATLAGASLSQAFNRRRSPLPL